MCGVDVIKPEERINYEYLVKEAINKYRNIFNSNWWEISEGNDKSQENPSPPKAHTGEIEQSSNKDLEQVYFIRNIAGNGNEHGGGSSPSSEMTGHKCDKKGHIQRY